MNGENPTNERKKQIGKRSKVAAQSATDFGSNKNHLLFHRHGQNPNPGQLVAAGELEHDEAEDEEALQDQENQDQENEVKQEEKNVAPDKERLYVKGNTKIDTFTAILNWKKYIIIFGIAGFVLLIILVLGILSSLISDDADGYNSYCQTGTNGTLLSFITSWEGGEDLKHSCDDNTGYIGYDIGDGTISIGSGMTNYVISGSIASNYIKEKGWDIYFNKNYNYTDADPHYRVDVGLCVPKNVINDLKLLVLEENFAKPIDEAAAKYNVELTQYQKDAITCFNYNLGPAHTEELVSAYASDGYEGLWNAMKDYASACINGNCGPLDSLKKRRKAEFALFVTGDYSDQGLFYSRGLDNYDFYDSEKVMSRRARCEGDISTNYNQMTSNGLNDVLTIPLKDKLDELGTSYEEFNEYILNNVIKSGVGTREGVVAAAVSLVGGLYEKYNIRIPYTWAGQHGGNISGISNPAGGEFFGVHPLWGSSISYYVHNSEVNRTYYHYGPDCSGFVMWALHNGGMKVNYSTANRTSLNGKRVGDPGDLMWHPGHIMLVVGVDDEAQKYYIAHAAGGDEGTKINTVNFTDSYNKIIKMDSFYANENNIVYNDAETFAEAFKAGQLNY